jgi:hypothetical protein
MIFQKSCRIARPPRIVALILVALAVAVPGPLFAEHAATREYKVKAAFLYNFALFTEWPDENVAGGGSSLVICVLGKHSFGDALESIQGKSVRRRNVTVRQINSVREMGICHVLFVSASEKQRLPDILSEVKNQPVLTVSDLDRFAEAGGTIGFISLEDRVRFEINMKAAQRARIRISSQLLKLAHDVIE